MVKFSKSTTQIPNTSKKTIYVFKKKLYSIKLYSNNPPLILHISCIPLQHGQCLIHRIQLPPMYLPGWQHGLPSRFRGHHRFQRVLVTPCPGVTVTGGRVLAGRRLGYRPGHDGRGENHRKAYGGLGTRRAVWFGGRGDTLEKRGLVRMDIIGLLGRSVRIFKNFVD